MIGTIRISQLPTSDPLDGTEVIIINQNGTTKRSTVGDAVGLVTSVQLSDYASVSGIATVAEGLTGNPSISVSALSVSGVSTLGNVQVSSGIVTATSGIVTYYGDGSKLQNIISGVGIQSTGTVIGTGITTLNFTGLGNTFSVNGSTVDINISGNTNISYASTTRTLSSSTGIGTVLPLVSTSSAGLQPARSFSTITYGAMVALDFASLDAQYRTISLTGNLELTTSNLANGRTLVIRLVADANQRTFTFPTDWRFLGTKPANIAASKVGVLSITAFGTTNADVVAAYAVQS
jgi:hypothetical protein